VKNKFYLATVVVLIVFLACLLARAATKESLVSRYASLCDRQAKLDALQTELMEDWSDYYRDEAAFNKTLGLSVRQAAILRKGYMRPATYAKSASEKK
jgi:hypothetical protein